jgi:hypothetical protein
MKTRITKPSTQHGTSLLVTLFLCSVLSVTIAGYLYHARQQGYLSARSQVWNSSIAVSEAGIEEGLAHLNTDTFNLTANGWAQSGNTYTLTRTLDAYSSYTVTIDASDMMAPKIQSTANVNGGGFAMAEQSQTTLFAIIGGQVTPTGGTQLTPAGGTQVSRAVRVIAGINGMFLKAMVAKHGINLNGNGIMTDSFNSSNPLYSSNGMYPSGNISMLLNNGDIASNDNIVNAISLGNANIYGHVSVGPNGTIAIGANGGVGDRAWQASHPGQMEPNYFSDDMNFTFPSVKLPYTSGLSPITGPVTVSTTNYIFAGNTNISSSVYPNPVPLSGVQSNATYSTVSSLPSPVPYGLVTNVLTSFTQSGTMPVLGTYQGTYTITSVITNTTTPPAAGTYTGNLVINTTNETTTTYPAAGTYSGNVTTLTTLTNSVSYPSSGSYTGLVTTNNNTGGNGNGSGGNSGHDGSGSSATTYSYSLITGYNYNFISGYSYNLVEAYSYNKIIGTNYTYPTYTYTYSYALYDTNVTTGTYDYIFQGGPVTAPPIKYYVDSISSGNILVQGNVQLVVGGNFSLGGNGSKNQLTIASDGKMEMYVGGPTLSLSGNGVVNQTGYAQNFLCWGADAVTSMTLNGNGTFTGIVVAPNADVTLNGGGYSNNDFIGSLISSSVTMNGHFSFHYDEALKNLKVNSRYLITDWHEILTSSITP